MSPILHWWDVMALGVGGMIGAGIYVSTGTAAHTYAGLAVVIAYLVAGIWFLAWTAIAFVFYFLYSVHSTYDAKAQLSLDTPTKEGIDFGYFKKFKDQKYEGGLRPLVVEVKDKAPRELERRFQAKNVANLLLGRLAKQIEAGRASIRFPMQCKSIGQNQRRADDRAPRSKWFELQRYWGSSGMGEKGNSSCMRVPKTMCEVLHLLFLLLLVVSSWLGEVQAQPPSVIFPPPGAALPPAGTFPPPDAALPPNVALTPAPPVDQTILILRQQVWSATQNITTELQKKYSYCITDGEKERDEVFGFNWSSSFLLNCFSETDNTVQNRLCGYGEILLYFKNIKDLDNPEPNENCNASSWNAGCESGWSAMPPLTETNIDLYSKTVPVRTEKPLPCCEGFFCPKGLSCMFPCPLGAYCPQAVLNTTSELCDPYAYQVPHSNNSIAKCGGADKWADVGSTEKIFCPAGKFCASTVEATNCSSGHYCRLGSTQEEPCSKLTSCSEEELEKENLTGIGGMIIAILTITLLLVFTCSDWLMDIRKKRKSKARDKAQKQAVESISGLERFRQAKDVAKRGATHFSRKLSHSMSYKRPTFTNQLELQSLSTFGGPASHFSQLGFMTDAICEEDSRDGANIPLSPSTFGPRDSSNDLNDHECTTAARIVPNVPINTNMEGLVRKSKDSNQKRPAILRLPQTQSQIFAYAYGEIEKEKATLSSSFSDMELEGDYYGASHMLGKMRPPIELSFVDLSLFLKGSGKKILSNVTGTLTPGRVTAVMGPSGAGKTTFLNALAGKATHSRTTGVVFINGKSDSIQSYKSIIGFVPQDDIVHGNLTVEENLWFSARYRLPVGMSKRDRVLVVERIIAALGLGPIRDSQVGTVEKRGISGGQRKRVNVGLEMVMEPSLLILDEPTSGLDSTSSRLVLQALRREASMGVNVGVVLHQPSYGLFKMFDDVMFLAKGGRTVYLGPVSEVEDYFAGIGLVVPNCINPPDHYMDALEGIAVPVDQPDFDPQNLPVMWLIKKGYNIPTNLTTRAAELQSGAPFGRSMRERVNPEGPKRKKTSFFQDFWMEVQAFFIVRKDLIISSFQRVDNKSGRHTPGFFRQFFIILGRVTKQRFRESRVQFQDYVILLLAGACLGPLSNMKDTTLGAAGYFYTLIALALLIMIASLRTFSNDKLSFWRESASGINRVAFFLAKDVVDLFNVVIKPIIYLSMFYFFSNPRSTFVSNFIVTLVLVYCVTGIAYICSILLEPAPAQLWSVFLPILATLIITIKRGGFILKLQYLSYARYANEAYVIANASNYRGVWIITRCAVLESLNYSIANWIRCLIVLVAYGLVARSIALICLFTSNRNKQK